MRRINKWYHKHQRGVALLMVLSLLTLLGSLIAEFQFSSQVDLQLAYHARDELQAEYNALSALRMRALLLKQSRQIQTLMNTLMPGTTLPIGQLLEMIPVECGLMSAITKTVVRNKSASAQQVKGAHQIKDISNTKDDEPFFPGECMATSHSEHSKIALNLLRSPTAGRAATVASFLMAALSDERFKKFFERNERNTDYAESPLALVGAITDWIDSDHTTQGNLGDEDRLYQFGRDPYKAKNAPFDSVAELQLVYGINDELYELLKDDVTIYSDTGLIELSVAPMSRILLWGIPACLQTGVPPDVLLPLLPELGNLLTLYQQSSGGMSALTIPILTELVSSAGMSQVIDTTKLASVFSDASSATWFSIDAQGQVGHASRRIHAVLQVTEDSFYYVRQE